MPPVEYVAKSSGLFSLRGGPLCGLYTDQLPPKRSRRKTIGLVYTAPSGREWMSVYEFKPDLLAYVFVGARVVLA